LSKDDDDSVNKILLELAMKLRKKALEFETRADDAVQYAKYLEDAAKEMKE